MNMSIVIERVGDLALCDYSAGVPAHLTTEHSASSYGLPVIVTDDGRVLSPADGPIRVHEWGPVDLPEPSDGAVERAIHAMEAAGYTFAYGIGTSWPGQRSGVVI